MTRPILPSSTEEEITELMPLEITWEDFSDMLDRRIDFDYFDGRVAVHHYEHGIDVLKYNWRTIGFKMDGKYCFREDVEHCRGSFVAIKRWTGMTKRQVLKGFENRTIGKIV